MANKYIKINDVEFSINPREMALFKASPSYFLANVLKMTLALIFKAKAEDGGENFDKIWLEERKKTDKAFNLVSAKNPVLVLANCNEFLAQAENIKKIAAEMEKMLGEYAPKAFETHLEEAQAFVSANKDGILAEMNKQ